MENAITWKLIVEHAEDDFQGGVLDAYLGMTPFEASVTEGSRTTVYLYPDKAGVQAAKRKIKTRYRAKVHCEIVPV